MRGLYFLKFGIHHVGSIVATNQITQIDSHLLGLLTFGFKNCVLLIFPVSQKLGTALGFVGSLIISSDGVCKRDIRTSQFIGHIRELITCTLNFSNSAPTAQTRIDRISQTEKGVF